MNTRTSTVQGPQKLLDNLLKFRPVNVKLATLNLNGDGLDGSAASVVVSSVLLIWLVPSPVALLLVLSQLLVVEIQ